MLRKVYQRIARPKQDDKNTKDGWNESYRDGYWDRLHALDEFAHNAVVAGYCNAIAQPSELRILDVGCGEGLLLNFLKIDRLSEYLGVDISEIAISRAASKESTSIRFKTADIEDADLENIYSIIIINECAYYFKDVISTLLKIKKALRDDGYIIVSMYVSRQTDVLWRTFAAQLEKVDEIEIKNIKGMGWKVVLFQKSQTGGGSSTV